MYVYLTLAYVRRYSCYHPVLGVVAFFNTVNWTQESEMKVHNERIYGIDLSLCSTKLLTGSYDGTAVVSFIGEDGEYGDVLSYCLSDPSLRGLW